MHQPGEQASERSLSLTCWTVNLPSQHSQQLLLSALASASLAGISDCESWCGQHTHPHTQQHSTALFCAEYGLPLPAKPAGQPKEVTARSQSCAHSSSPTAHQHQINLTVARRGHDPSPVSAKASAHSPCRTHFHLPCATVSDRPRQTTIAAAGFLEHPSPTPPNCDTTIS